jgi:hypothetical protein
MSLQRVAYQELIYQTLANVVAPDEAVSKHVVFKKHSTSAPADCWPLQRLHSRAQAVRQLRRTSALPEKGERKCIAIY